MSRECEITCEWQIFFWEVVIYVIKGFIFKLMKNLLIYEREYQTKCTCLAVEISVQCF